MEEDSEKLILVITGDQDDDAVTAAAAGITASDIAAAAAAENASFVADLDGVGGHGVKGGVYVDTEVPEPFADVLAGEVLFVCPADCSHYSREAEDMSQHISIEHGTPMSPDRLAPVVFESVSHVYVDCTHCEDQCFRDVTLTYKAQSSNPTGKAVRRTVSVHGKI
jgi:hypothetical protein